MTAEIKNAPARIYLNLGPVPSEEIEFSALHDVTWCADKQDVSDIEYVLAPSDAAQAPKAVAWECASPAGEKPMLAFLTSKEPTREHYEYQGWRVTPLYLAAPVARAASPSEWQPIETAPKTGRTLLLGYLNSAGKWRTVRGQWMSANYIEAHWEDPDDVEPGWFETSAEADDVPNCWGIEPTHWMPLPAAPQGAEQ